MENCEFDVYDIVCVIGTKAKMIILDCGSGRKGHYCVESLELDGTVDHFRDWSKSYPPKMWLDATAVKVGPWDPIKQCEVPESD